MKIQIILFIGLGILLVACKKLPGEGGTAKIKGKVVIEEYDKSFTRLKDTYYATGEDVYIIYGDDETFSDDTETNYDGSFSFEYLRKGNYKIFVYSKDSCSGNNEIAIIKNVSIEKKGEIKETENIVILKTSGFFTGSSVISGKVYALDYDDSLNYMHDQYYEPKEDVYLVYESDDFYIDDVETNYDGTYRFSDLPEGNYTVYAYSKDTTNNYPAGRFPVMKSVSITASNQTIEVEDIVIVK